MSPYDVLDISPKATEEEIRAAYRAMAKKWHPDRMLDDQETATKKFMEISSAYRAILRERRRETGKHSSTSNSSTSSSDKKSNSASSNAGSPDENRHSSRSRTKQKDEKGTTQSSRSSGRDENSDHSRSSNRHKGEGRSSSEKSNPDTRHKESSTSRSSSASSPSSQKSSSSSSSPRKPSSPSSSSSSPHRSSSSSARDENTDHSHSSNRRRGEGGSSSDKSNSDSQHKESSASRSSSSSSPQKSSSSSSSSSSPRNSPSASSSSSPQRSSPSSSSSSTSKSQSPSSSSPSSQKSSSPSSSSSRQGSSSSSSSSPQKSSSSSASPPSRPSSSSSSRSSASSSSSACESDSDEGLSSASSCTSVSSASTDSLLDQKHKRPKVNGNKCPIPNGSTPSFTSYTSSEVSAYDNPEITPPPDTDSLRKETEPRGENPNPKPSGNDSTAGVTSTPSPPARPPDGHRNKLTRPHRDKPKDSATGKMRKPADEDGREGRTLIPEYDSPLACAMGVSKEWTYTVRLTLEELFYGKKLRFHVLRCKLDGKRKTVILDIDVPPGSAHGTQMVFKGAGHERKDGTRQDIIFIIEEVKHERFVRLKDDLALDVRLPWVESLKKEAAVVYAKGIDGEQSEFEVDFRRDGDVTGTAVFPGAGMPVPGTTRRGKLIVRWEIYMPSAPSRWEALKQALHL